MSKIHPSRGEVWWVDLNPVIGKEQAKKRPCLVVSSEIFNRSKSGLIVIVPLTSKEKMKNVYWVHLPKEISGMNKDSVLLCDQVRSVSISRFSGNCKGIVNQDILGKVEYALKVLFDIYS